MHLLDAVGLVGVVLVLIAYVGAAMGRYPANGGIALAANLVGACLILVSMIGAYNLSAFAMEGSWALVALTGLVRLAFRRRPPSDR